MEQETEVELFSRLPTLLNPQEREKEKQQGRKTTFSQIVGIISHLKNNKTMDLHMELIEIRYNLLLNKETKMQLQQ